MGYDRDFTPPSSIVFQAFVHPRFQFSPAADRYDVAVLRLERPVRYAPHITPICLPEAGRDPSPGTHAYVAGWGALIPGGTTKQLLVFLSGCIFVDMKKKFLILI